MEHQVATRPCNLHDSPGKMHAWRPEARDRSGDMNHHNHSVHNKLRDEIGRRHVSCCYPQCPAGKRPPSRHLHWRLLA
jgi:hypothetical protein